MPLVVTQSSRWAPARGAGAPQATPRIHPSTQARSFGDEDLQARDGMCWGGGAGVVDADVVMGEGQGSRLALESVRKVCYPGVTRDNQNVDNSLPSSVLFWRGEVRSEFT